MIYTAYWFKYCPYDAMSYWAPKLSLQESKRLGINERNNHSLDGTLQAFLL